MQFTLRGRVTKMMNYDPRAEWRTDFAFGTYYGIATELYQPFSFKSWWFVAPHAAALRSPYDYYNQDELVAQYNLTSLSAGVDLGYALSRKAEVRVGEDIAYLRADRKVGTDEYPNHSGFTGVSTFRFVYLGQDDAIIPHQGLKSQTRGAYYTSGNDGKPYPMAETLNSYFVRLNPKSSLFFVADGGTAFGHKNLGITSFTLGGPLRFGAYGRNALIGDEYYLLQGGYLHRVASISPIIGEGVYAGAFYEIGKVYGPSYLTNQLPMDGSLLVVAKTILAPVFVGISIGDSARYKWWFGVGRVF